MGKHGRNATASAVYSYHERKKDAAGEGYGTLKARLGSDSLRDIDHCCLSLQSARDPVVTPDGFIFDKQAILENLLHQKVENMKKLKLYEKQKEKYAQEQALLEAEANRKKAEDFAKQESSVTMGVKDHFKEREQEVGHATKLLLQKKEQLATAQGKKEAPLPSFWIPGQTPEAKPTRVTKPSNIVRCPMSGKPLKIKDLTAVKFTPVDANEKNIHFKEERWMCPVTRTVLRKGIECAVIKPTGRVVTMDCIRRLVRKEMRDPISGEKLRESDIIVLQTAGTGYAGSGAALEAEKQTPVPSIS